MFVTIKGMIYYNLPIYLEIFARYCIHMVNTILKYVGMYWNNFNVLVDIISIT